MPIFLHACNNASVTGKSALGLQQVATERRAGAALLLPGAAPNWQFESRLLLSTYTTPARRFDGRTKGVWKKANSSKFDTAKT